MVNKINSETTYENESIQIIINNKYKLKNINVIHNKFQINYDGFDKDGPDSCYSIDYYIYYRIGYNYYFDVWHKPDEYTNEYYLKIYKMKNIDYSDNEFITYLQTNHVYEI